MSKQHKAFKDESEGDQRIRTQNRLSTKKLEKTKVKVKSGKSLPNNAIRGIVMSPAGPTWWVECNAELWLCTVSGTVYCPHTSTMVAVGDRVWVVPEHHSLSEKEPNSGLICRIEERDTLLSRKAAGKQEKEQVVVANVDQIAVVVAAVKPNYNRRLIDRYLIAADKGDLHPIIVVNKTDLLNDDEFDHVFLDLSVYFEKLEIDVLFVSAETGSGLDTLMESLADRETIFSGPSGVGKSSLINKLCGLNLRVGVISETFEKGMHTTTGAERIHLENGGAIIDTPGIREFAIWELDPAEVKYYFPEFEEFSTNCRFTSCTHTHEPNCAVVEAVEADRIDVDRYISYCYILNGNADDMER